MKTGFCDKPWLGSTMAICGGGFTSRGLAAVNAIDSASDMSDLCMSPPRPDRRPVESRPRDLLLTRVLLVKRLVTGVSRRCRVRREQRQTAPRIMKKNERIPTVTWSASSHHHEGYQAGPETVRTHDARYCAGGDGWCSGRSS